MTLAVPQPGEAVLNRFVIDRRIEEHRHRWHHLPAISYSEMMAWGTCRQKHHWIYARNLEPQQDAPRPTFGSAGHYALEAHYTGNDVSSALDSWVTCMIGDTPMFDEEIERYRDIAATLKGLIPRYARHYATDDLIVVGAEIEFNVKLPGFGVRLNGYWDALALDPHGRLWIMDHKFVTPGSGFRAEWELEMDLQVGIYHWAARQLGLDVYGTIYNQIRAQLPKIPQLLQSGKALSRAEIATDWETYRAEVVRHGFDPNDYDDVFLRLSQRQWFERIYLVRTDEQLDRFWVDLGRRTWDMRRRRPLVYMTPNRVHCASCPFRDLCIEMLAGRDPEPIIETAFRPRRRRDERRPATPIDEEVSDNGVR